MPSPPKVDILIDKAVHFVMKKTMTVEYEKIRYGIKELVDKVIEVLQLTPCSLFLYFYFWRFHDIFDSFIDVIQASR
jgi:hypothetical protein